MILLAEDLNVEISKALPDVKQAAVRETKLCDSCLGRLFGRLGRNFSNAERGQILRKHLTIEKCAESDCRVCKGLVLKIDDLSGMAVKSLNEWEFSTFLIGTKFDPEIQEAEESLWAETEATHAEPIKAEFNREIGKRVEINTGKPAEFSRPDIVAIVDTMYETVSVQVSPMHIFGRYRKLTRGIPQTRWPCRECKGKGCDRCGGTGKMYQTSVEEIVGTRALQVTRGKDHRFHGMGREDIDALMLGTGRPFVLEIKEPKIRKIDLTNLMNLVNGGTKDVEVSGLRYSNGEEVVLVKKARPDKKYRVQVEFTATVDGEKINEVVASLGGNSIAQRTPMRVAHRRADRERTRMIKSIETESQSSDEAVFGITAEAGTYIKEFVHGDGGRTVPSISGELGVECKIKTLDVLEIMDKDEE